MNDIKVRFQQWNCIAVFGLYDNLRLAIQLLDEEDKDLVATATVNLPDEELQWGLVLVKGYSENEGMEQALIDAGIIHPEVKTTKASGHVLIKGYEITDEVKEIYDYMLSDIEDFN